MNEESLLKLLSAPGAIAAAIVWLHFRTKRLEDRLDAIFAHFGISKPAKGKSIRGPVAIITALGLSLFASSGCKSLTPEQNAANIQRLSYAAASIGTAEALAQNPGWRPQFSLAYTNLDRLVTSRVITGTLLHQVIADLPVKELKSPEARIAIEGATFLYDSFAGTSVNIETNIYVLAAASGLRDGLKTGLGY